MSFEWDDVLKDAEGFQKKRPDNDRPPGNDGGNSGAPPGQDRPQTQTEQAWDLLFLNRHPEGGGPFKGRDNALIALVGCFRRKRIPFEAARQVAILWNCEKCVPPLDESLMLEKIGERWHQWQEGPEGEASPEDFQQKAAETSEWEFKSADYLLDLEAGGHGLKWFVPNILVDGGYHFVSAPAAGAKTWWLIDLGISVAAGRPWMGQDIEAAEVLYADMELGEGQFATRFKKLSAPRGIPFTYLDEDVKLDRKDDVARLIAFIKERAVRLLIIDTFSRVWSGDENDNRQVRAFGSVVKSIRKETGVTVVLAHHDRKSRAEGDSPVSHERMRGGGDIAAQCDLAYAITKAGDNLFELTTTKNRVLPSEDALHVFFTLQDNEDHSHLSVHIVDAEERSERVVDAIAQRILSALEKHGKMNTSTLCDNVTGNAKTIIATVKRMVDDGRVVSTKVANAYYYEIG